MMLRAVNSVLAQTYPNTNAIIVDDGSTDDTRELYQIYFFDNNRVEYFYKDNGGVSSARNFGIRRTRGDLCGFLDSDDELYPNHVETLVTSMLKEPQYGAMYTISEYQIPKAKKREVLYDYEYKRDMFGYTNLIPSCCLLFHRYVFDKVGLFDETLPVYEDWDMWARIAKYWDFKQIKKITCCVYKGHPQLTLRPNNSKDKALVASLQKKFKYFLERDLKPHERLNMNNIKFKKHIELDKNTKVVEPIKKYNKEVTVIIHVNKDWNKDSLRNIINVVSKGSNCKTIIEIVIDQDIAKDRTLASVIRQEMGITYIPKVVDNNLTTINIMKQLAREIKTRFYIFMLSHLVLPIRIIDNLLGFINTVDCDVAVPRINGCDTLQDIRGPELENVDIVNQGINKQSSAVIPNCVNDIFITRRTVRDPNSVQTIYCIGNVYVYNSKRESITEIPKLQPSCQNIINTPATNINKVSVIIDYRNRKRHDTLNAVLNSLANQTYSDYSVTVVEQDSETKKPDNINVNWIFAYNPKDYNRSWGFNIGFKQTKADLYIFHDADLVVEPTFIENIVSIINTKGIHFTRSYTTIEYCNKDGAIYASKNNSYGGSIACTRELYEKINGHNEIYEGWGWEDIDFARRCKTTIWPQADNILKHLWHGYDSTNPRDKMNSASSIRNESFFKNMIVTNKPIGDINKYSNDIRYSKEYIDFENIAFVFGIRGTARIDYLLRITDLYRTHFPSAKLVLVEQDTQIRMSQDIKDLFDKYIFTPTSNLYNRSWAFNTGFNALDADIYIFQDIDLFMIPNDLKQTITYMRDNNLEVISPYNEVLDLAEDISKAFLNGQMPIDKVCILNNIIQVRTWCLGGMIIFTKEGYIKIKGHDECFCGWGGEDNFIWHKANMLLKEHVKKLDNKLYHLWHTYENPKKEHPYFKKNWLLANDSKDWTMNKWNDYISSIKHWGWRYKDNKPKISIGMTTFNRCDHLKKSLGSLIKSLRPELFDYEIFVTDDGSEDDTIVFLQDLSLRIPFLTFKTFTRGGIHYQANRILSYFNGKVQYGFFCNDDILFSQGWEEFYINGMNSTNVEHFIFCDLNYQRRYSGPIGIVSNIVKGGHNLIYYGNIQGAFMTFTQNLIDTIGGQDALNFGMCGYGHIDWSLRCIRGKMNYGPYDLEGSNSYLHLIMENYRQASDKPGKEKSLDFFNKVKNDNNRVFIPLVVKDSDNI